MGGRAAREVCVSTHAHEFVLACLYAYVQPFRPRGGSEIDASLCLAAAVARSCATADSSALGLPLVAGVAGRMSKLRVHACHHSTGASLTGRLVFCPREFPSLASHPVCVQTYCQCRRLGAHAYSVSLRLTKQDIAELTK